MVLPEIARKVGTIERKQIVYIEEYVLQYLSTYGCESISKDEEISLYGRHECREGVNIYIIYAACKKSEEQDMLQKIMENGNVKDAYIKIGSIRHRSSASVVEESLKTVEAGKNHVGPLNGYYIFYDSNEWMKDYLVQHYERKTERKYKVERCHEQHANVKVREMQEETPELTALSNTNYVGQVHILYRWIRMAVLCIMIIFCAIAVTTINEHEKMKGFVQTIRQTCEWAEEATWNEF